MTFRHYRPKTFCSRDCARKKMPRRRADPARTLTSLCPQCGRSFRHPASEKRIYCSKPCAGRSKRPTGFDTVCEACGATFATTPKATRGRFCSRRCYGRWLAADPARSPGLKKFVKGHKTRRRGGPPVTKTCPVCAAPFTVKASHAAKRVCCSRTCLGVVLAERLTGPANPLWRGGPEPYYGPSWQAARRFVRARDRVCQSCGKTARRNGKALDVHHRVPFRSFGAARHAEANAPSNLVALCTVCHTREEWATLRRA